MRATGGQIGLTAQEIEAFSQQIGGTTLASIGEVRQAFAELATSGIVFGDTAARTIQASQDLAAVFGGTLAQNMDLLVRTAIKVNSGVEGFRERFGIAIPDALQRSIEKMQELGDTQGAMNALLTFVNSLTGGQGVAGAADTLAGAFQGIQEAFQRFLESTAGTAALEGLKDILRTTAQEINDITDFVNGIAARGGLFQLLFGNLPPSLEKALALIQSIKAEVGEEGIVGALGIPESVRGLFARSPMSIMASRGEEDLNKAVDLLADQLNLTEQMAEIRRQSNNEEIAGDAQRFKSAFDAFNLEQQRREEVDKAAQARQRELAIQAAQKRAVEEAIEAGKERARLEEANQRKMEQDLIRVENILERIQARRIELLGGSEFEQLKAREGGTSAFRIHEEQIEGGLTSVERIEEFQKQLKASDDFIQESLKEQRSAISQTANFLSSELIGAWRSVTAAAVEGGDVTKATLLSILGIAQSVAERVAAAALTAGIAGSLSPGIAQYLAFAHGGSFTAGEATGSSVIHMLPPRQKGIFAGRAQHGLDFMIPGGGATDSVPVSFLATPGEQVTVRPPGRGGTGGADLNLNINVSGGSPDQQAMLEVFGHHLVEQAVNRSVGRTLDLVTRDRTVRRIIRGGRR